MNANSTIAPLAHGRVTKEALEALYATGHRLHARGRYEDAAAVFRILILCAPHDERGYLALGSCHEGLEQEAIALEIYGAAILCDVPSVRCHLARGRLLRAAGHDDEADDALDEAERIADGLDDDHLRSLVAFEREVP